MISFQALLTDSGLPRHELWPLLETATGRAREWIVARPEASPEPGAAALIARWIEARKQGVPIAYLTGFREFYGRRFWVTPDTLIPRQDTEILIDTVHALVGSGSDSVAPDDSNDLDSKGFEGLRLCDLGGGSGCIGVSLALEFPGSEVTITDISPNALKLARHNAAWLGAEPFMQFRLGSWWKAFDNEPSTRFHGICSNPPYIRHDDAHLQQGDLRFEPSLALTGISAADGRENHPIDPRGLAAIRDIVAGGVNRLEPGGFLLIEHGFDQQNDVIALMDTAGFVLTQGIQDLSGQPRAVLGLKSPE